MKKKTLLSVLLMLFLFAQQAAAMRFRIRVHGDSSGEPSPYMWIVYVVVIAIVLFGLYTYIPKIKSFYYMIVGGFRMDAKTKLNEDEQRKMLLSAPLSLQDKAVMNTIKTALSFDDLNDELKRIWKIKNHDSAIAMLSELKIGCTKSYIPQIVEVLKGNKPVDQYLNDTFVLEKDIVACRQEIEYASKSFDKLVKHGIVKDLDDFMHIGDAGSIACHLVYLARKCFELDYISEEEMWEYVNFADEIAHKSYHSWADFGKSTCIGYVLNGGVSFQLKAHIDAVKKLVEDPKSPWKTFPFGN